MIHTREAVREDFYAMMGFRPAGFRIAYVAIDGNEPIALAGLMRDPSYVGTFLEEEGPWVAVFETRRPLPPILAARIIAALRHGIRALGEEIWVQCDDSFPSAERFCKTLGFTPTDKTSISWKDPKRKLRMWRWQPLAQLSA